MFSYLVSTPEKQCDSVEIFCFFFAGFSRVVILDFLFPDTSKQWTDKSKSVWVGPVVEYNYD